MKPPFRRGRAALVNLAIAAVASAAHGADYDFANMERFIESSLPDIGGGVSLILVRGDAVIYEKGFGTLAPDRVVPLASSSKGISGVVMMSLVDGGLISLDTRASEYLPEFTERKAELTIRQLFSHTHGFPYKPYHHRDTSIDLEEAARRIAGVPLLADPGTALYYSGLGMQVAGRIAEIVTGKAWNDIFEERVARPLEMTHTDYYAFGRLRADASEAQKRRVPNVAGSARTSAEDYANLVTMLLNKGVFKGRRVLSEAAVDELFKIQSGNVAILRHPWEPYAEWDAEIAQSPYSVGWWIERVERGSGRAQVISSGGAFGAQPFVDRRRNLAGIYLPFSREIRFNTAGQPYNAASRVYLELQKIIRETIPEVRTR